MANAGTDLVGVTAIKINLTAKAAIDLSTTKDVLTIDESNSWTFGHAANGMEMLFHDQISVTTDGVTINVRTGATGRVDGFGNAAALDYLKFLYIKNTHATSTLMIGGTANTIPILSGDTDTLNLPPGASLLIQAPSDAGIDVSTGVTLFLDASAGTILADVAYGGDDSTA